MLDERPEFRAAERIDTGGRLIEQHQARLVQGGKDNAEFPAHAPGEGARKTVAHVVQACALKQYLLARTGGGRGDPIRVRDKLEVLGNRQRAPHAGVSWLYADVCSVRGAAMELTAREW